MNMNTMVAVRNLLRTVAAATVIALSGIGLTTGEGWAQAGIFEVVHPDVEQGEIEIEALNSYNPNDVEDGEERSVHEFAIGYGFTDYWKFTAAVEVANPEGDDPLVEAFEFENLVILFGGHHDDDGDAASGEAGHADFTLGFYAALEVPKEGGIGEGGVAFGPVFEVDLGNAEFVGNVLVEKPFADDEDAGLAYATQLVLPTDFGFDVGVETYGEFEGLFGDRGDDSHFAGPAVYWEAELSNGHVIEPRLAVLFGLTDETPDATVSFNIEYKIGGH